MRFISPSQDADDPAKRFEDARNKIYTGMFFLR